MTEESARPDRKSPAESEQNPPEDRRIGFKPWDEERERFWTGKQWTETYRSAS